MNILSKMTMKDNPKAIIQWCEAEIAEYEKLIAIIRNNISPKWRKMTKKQALDEIGDQKIQTLLESVIPAKKKIDKKFGTDGCRYPTGWNACIEQIRKNTGLTNREQV